MGNMSYCRFENTTRDFDDCSEAIENFLYGDEEISERELSHAARLIEKSIEMLGHLANHEGKGVGEFVTELYDSVDVEEHTLSILNKANQK